MVVLQKGTRPILLYNSALSNKKVGHASALELKVFYYKLIFFNEFIRLVVLSLLSTLGATLKDSIVSHPK